MQTTSTGVELECGPAPRRVSLAATFERCPMNLQVGLICTSLGLLAVLAWLAFDPASPDAGKTLFVAVPAFALAVAWASRVRRLVVHGRAVVGEVVRVCAGGAAFATCSEVRYAYEVDGRRHRGSFLTGEGALVFDLHGGTPILVLVDPRWPSISVPWSVPSPPQAG